jgi:hypothetical protein
LRIKKYVVVVEYVNGLLATDRHMADDSCSSLPSSLVEVGWKWVGEDLLVPFVNRK